MPQSRPIVDVTELHGYKEAAEIDEIIDNRVEQVGMTPENAAEWMKFARTIETTAHIIYVTAENLLKIARRGS